ncbi:tetratricopeptide repeat protein [Pseudomonas luteola]|uniref:tetratricopeptide repeat protein n=1 Tax=Pseudomonas luteola TaxID=47886 RepID=UPI001238CCB4|nr:MULTISPECIES: tetratricopeptide repeat protein [Pseudomonas]MBA1248168.1 sel1 repeat family protein [Pseudomonas zeshuii]QEU30177.1 sel1 repeat family protein [Pseudomonas luteola]
MHRAGRFIITSLLLFPLLAFAGGNSLLIPSTSRCNLNAAPEELPQALSKCQQTARAGDAQAQYELGSFYYDGKQTPKDLNQARIWFEQASLKGHADAQYRLGTMFFRGEGVQANTVQAYIVLKMAAINGSEDAMDTADLVSEQMRRDELEIATQVLGQIFRDYLQDLQTAGTGNPFAPLP